MSRGERPTRSDSGSDWSSAFRRDSDADALAEDEIFRPGCSMLSRIRMRPDVPGTMRPLRCSLGYELTTDDDAAKCMAVEGPSACWKAASPSWRVQPVLEEQVEPPVNGHTHPEAVVVEIVAETDEVVAPAGDEVIEIELLSIDIVGDDA